MNAEQKVQLFKYAMWIANAMLVLGVGIAIYIFLQN